MHITELATPTAPQTLGERRVQAAVNRDRQLLLQFTATPAQMPALEALWHQFDLVFEAPQVLVPLAAVAPLAEALVSLGFADAAADLTAIYDRHRIWWQAGRYRFDVTDKPLVYGILNVSPDSFYDGGRFVAPEAMRAQVQAMVTAGVDVIEVGGQTTRPGFTPVTPEVELQRVAPVLAFLRQAFPDLPIAIDTYKYPVMVAALEAGVDIINDVNAFTDDPRKLALLAPEKVGLLTMHSNRDREYSDLTREMRDFFTTNLAALEAAGIAGERIALDQGIGYAKVADGQQDFAMMRNLDMLNDFKRPLMVAISRKGFGAQLFGLAKDDRLAVTLIAESAMFLRGGNILRVHDVAETVQLRKMLQTIESAYWLP
ncbi:dihydropteroate synthase [Lacticaseibacillus sp. GG6-2]